MKSFLKIAIPLAGLAGISGAAVAEVSPLDNYMNVGTEVFLQIVGALTD